MSLPMLNAFVAGYEDYIFDLQIVAVHGGYWAGYYSRTKKPKTLKNVLESMFRRKNKAANIGKSKNTAPDVNVEEFLERERRFKARLEQQQIYEGM